MEDTTNYEQPRNNSAALEIIIDIIDYLKQSNLVFPNIVKTYHNPEDEKHQLWYKCQGCLSFSNNQDELNHKPNCIVPKIERLLKCRHLLT